MFTAGVLIMAERMAVVKSAELGSLFIPPVVALEAGFPILEEDEVVV